ncbi:serine/threonine protein kinase [Gordonia sp. HY002]|uniref:serine/threonine-protein kinase n=1 Tax=Gordonia zhenghanii TaxID=2911516 RepID=UPI001EF04CF4|nr:serine/threonine-protein kinase [Gordonia zhenghanii]MCF8572068.1 serine/threonine protein kinase [Gordonia zhenghanii]MCF8602942.1 serine/threonine protein kinase [Gordonia zhenghanii]
MSSPDSSGPDSSGTVLGPYRLVRLLGRGGMGEVYEAVDTVKGRTVALKLLPAALADDHGYRTRFLRESRTVARLNDPHVIPIHDFGEIDGRLYLDMRIVHGRDLRSVLGDGPLHPERAVAIIGQIAGALDAAHASGLLHRDVKPENILIDGNDFAYLVDFGIAQAAGSTRLTQTGTAIGSFAYMAPERFGDSVELTPAADVYSLACVLYEAVTGAPPYAATSIEQIISGHLTRPIPPSGTVLDPVIAAGSAKDPGRRMQTCGALAAAARDVLAGRYAPTLVAGVPTAHAHPPQAPPADRGRIALVAAAVVVVVALIAGGLWFGLRSTSDDEPATVADTSASPPTGNSQSLITTTVTQEPETETEEETATPSRESGDLGLSTPISSPPCDGRTVAFVYNATTPGSYEQEVGDALASHPGSAYLRTDQSCSSLRHDLDGNPIYAVYLEGSSLTETCRIKADIGGETYARRLDETTPVGVEIC